MSVLSAGAWIIAHWSSITAVVLLIGGFAFAWQRQAVKSVTCFLACFGLFIVGGLQ